MRGQNTWEEILSQPTVWQAALDHAASNVPSLRERWPIRDFGEVLFIGCGSTHYLSQTAAALTRHIVRVPSRAQPSSEMYLFADYSQPACNGSTMLWAVSRSGETTETILATRAFRERLGGPVLTVGNYPDSTLAREADAALIIPEGAEESVAQTRSFSSMLVTLTAYLAASQNDGSLLASLSGLPAAASQVLRRDSSRLQQLGADATFDSTIFLGSGPNYGIACEGMLKLKEMSLSTSEAYHFMEFRHGPKSIVTERTLIAAILSDTAIDHELKVLREMRQLGATVMLVCEEDPYREDAADIIVPLGSGMPEAGRTALCLVPLQLLAYGRSIAKGLDPDRPANLSSVIIL